MELPTIPTDQSLTSAPEVTAPQTTTSLPRFQSAPFLLIGVLVLVFLLGLISYLFYQNHQLRLQVATKKSTTDVITNQVDTEPTTNSTPSITQTTDEVATTNLLTYKSPRHHISFDHAPSWSVEEVDGAVPLIKIMREHYLIIMDFPDGFGPGVCVFSDHPDFTKELEGPISKCAGEFTSIATANGEMRRRLYDVINDTTFGWQILSKNTESGYFVTVPPISYQTPRYYDEQILKEMDRIVASYKSLKE